MNNKSSHYKRFRKAGLFACLFLFVISQTAEAQWSFDQKTAQAYDLVMDLRIAAALEMLADPETPEEHYVASFARALDLLITEDQDKFSEYEDIFLADIDKNMKGSKESYQLFRAEAHLQWTFVYLKFGHEIDAASHLRQAYQIAQDCRRESPDFLPIRKTYGLLQVIVGSVPEKYNWVLSLLGMRGSVTGGLSDLKAVAISGSELSHEAELLLAVTKGYIQQKPDSALTILAEAEGKEKKSRLSTYIASTLAMKNSQSELALKWLNSIQDNAAGLPLYYTDYLKGEIYLHKGDYLNAISSYRWFINHYKGQNYIKDAHYKIGLCYWLNGNVNDALAMFDEAKNIGQEYTEADRSAGMSLAQKELPHLQLSKARYAMDGGYYTESRNILLSLSDNDLPSTRNQVEYFYRKARLEHQTKQHAAAKLFYKQTIDLARNENWYYAPNACLQMGYILMTEGNSAEAKQYFQQALKYKKHEYKNSIDSKARSALSRLR